MAAGQASRTRRCGRAVHKEGTTIALITHDRDIAAQPPRHVEIQDGRIVADRVAVDRAAVDRTAP